MLWKIKLTGRIIQKWVIIFIIGHSMFEWKISAKVTECQGLAVRKSAEYSLLLGLDDKFSNPSPVATHSDTFNHQNIAFNALLILNFKTDTCELPSSQLQLILVMSQKQDTKKSLCRKEEIIGIATITIFYPLQEYLKGFRIFRFEKSLDSKATIKAQILLEVSKKQLQFKSHSPKNSRSLHQSPRSRDSLQHSQGAPSKKKSLSGSERSSDSRPLSKSQIDSHTKYAETIKALTQQRNQLYKMSEDLYTQLKQCSKERDHYLKQLREREVSEQQIKAQLQFLKLKVYQYQQTQSHHQHNVLEQQLWQLQSANQQLQATVKQQQKIIKQLQRKVKESLIALHDFKQEAVTARSELIHKQSQLTFISKHSRNLDTAECIQQLITQLQQRNFQQPFELKCFYQQDNNLTEMAALIKKDIAFLFTKLLARLRIQKDKEWLLKEKVQFERGLEDRVLQFSTYDNK